MDHLCRVHLDELLILDLEVAAEALEVIFDLAWQ